MQDQARHTDSNAWIRRFQPNSTAVKKEGEFLHTFHQEFSSLVKKTYHGSHLRTAVVLPEHLLRALRAVDRQIVRYVASASSRNWIHVETVLTSLLSLCISSSSEVRKAAYFSIKNFLIPDMELRAAYDPKGVMPSLVLISNRAWHTDLRLRANEVQERLFSSRIGTSS